MTYWKREPFEKFISEGHFRVTDAGPLNAPVLSFTLRRNDKLELILETVCGDEAEKNALLREMGIPRPGTVRVSTNTVELESIGGTKITLGGVEPYSTHTFENYQTGHTELHEEAKVHQIEAALLPAEQPVYTIDWLENVGDGYYLWPDSVVNKTETLETRAFGRAPGSIIMSDTDERFSSGRCAILMTVAGIEFYLCTANHNKDSDQIKPGYILYIGTPDEDVRRKIRTVLSFTLGMYLVYLGNATYSPDWKLVSFKAVRAYSIDKRAFELHIMPPCLLGDRAHNELSHGPVSRLVTALYAHYDDLQFGALNWAYWHALCAPLHIAAVHFGAAIEALQRRYITVHAADFETRIIGDKLKWENFVGSVGEVVDGLEITPEAKDSITANVGLLNQVPRRAVTDELLRRIGIVLGDDERKAWKRRHDAAHGNDMAEEDAPMVIRDVKLLKVLFHRMLLKIVNGSDLYYDYASLDFPLRRLEEPIPSVEKVNTTSSGS